MGADLGVIAQLVAQRPGGLERAVADRLDEGVRLWMPRLIGLVHPASRRDRTRRLLRDQPSARLGGSQPGLEVEHGL